MQKHKLINNDSMVKDCLDDNTLQGSAVASHIERYKQDLIHVLTDINALKIENLYQALLECWKEDRKVFICGNGGSAGNSIHFANDLMFGVAEDGVGIRAESLNANASNVSCIANDIGYDAIFSHQLSILARKGDLLIVLSGSGQSANILKALKVADQLRLNSFAMVGYDGGKAKRLAHNAIHFPVQNMQISEDLQLMVAHMVTHALRQYDREHHVNESIDNKKVEKELR